MKRDRYRYMLRGRTYRIYAPDGNPVEEEPFFYSRREAADRVKELNQTEYEQTPSHTARNNQANRQ